ncbi:hypothetical protein [Lacihabitans lacunae]|uniref:Uncharacterized protein n=1 Tax=Lacihabitans lacunae TaxID=1028214 RepID=A0ABV7YXT1_9BACT
MHSHAVYSDSVAMLIVKQTITTYTDFGEVGIKTCPDFTGFYRNLNLCLETDSEVQV